MISRAQSSLSNSKVLTFVETVHKSVNESINSVVDTIVTFFDDCGNNFVADMQRPSKVYRLYYIQIRSYFQSKTYLGGIEVSAKYFLVKYFFKLDYNISQVCTIPHAVDEINILFIIKASEILL